jgi:hypothetical protein
MLSRSVMAGELINKKELAPQPRVSTIPEESVMSSTDSNKVNSMGSLAVARVSSGSFDEITEKEVMDK